MGGEIAVASQPGAGSRFTVRLMLSAVRAPRRLPAAEPRPTGYAGRRRLVVVADDDPSHRWLMRDALTPLGFIVLEAGDGAESLRLAADCRPDAFLLDLSMPGISGWDLARRLRQSGHTAAAILIISANAGDLRAGPPADAEPDPGLRPSHDDVLAKPVSIATLLTRLATLLDLEWQAAPTAGAGPGVLALSPEVLAELTQLGRIGYVRGILGKLDEIARAAPAPGIDTLRRAAAECRLDDFLALLAGETAP